MKEEYYIIPYIEELAATTDPVREKWLRRRIAANVGNPEALERILGLAEADPLTFYPDQRPTLSTSDTIDAFLDRFGQKSTVPTGQEEGIPVMPAIDYLTLAGMAGQGGTPRPRIPDEKEPENPFPEPAEPEKDVIQEGPGLTESFAKILIKNGNYGRAMEILAEVNLKNPEKSIYFADQMRFLRKLQLLQGRR